MSLVLMDVLANERRQNVFKDLRAPTAGQKSLVAMTALVYIPKRAVAPSFLAEQAKLCVRMAVAKPTKPSASESVLVLFRPTNAALTGHAAIA